MWIKIRADKIRFSMPVPLSMVGFLIRRIPDSELERMRKDVPAPYDALVDREYFNTIWQACRDSFRECKGMELVHVEAQDGTFVSIKM